MELKTILSTKTLDNKALILAHSLGMNLSCVDFIQINKLRIDLTSLNQQSFDSVVFTSSNSVKYFFENEEAKTFLGCRLIFSLSEKTFSELLSHNIRPDYIKKNAADLAVTIIKLQTVKSVLHVCGNRRLDVLENTLRRANINYVALPVYETELKSISLNKTFQAILFYSPSGVQGYFSANQPGAQTIFCCIGETTNAELKKYQSGAKIILSDVPSPEAMIKALGEYFRNKPAA